MKVKGLGFGRRHRTRRNNTEEGKAKYFNTAER